VHGVEKAALKDSPKRSILPDCGRLSACLREARIIAFGGWLHIEGAGQEGNRKHAFLETMADEWRFGGDGRGLKRFLCGTAKSIIRYRLASAFFAGAQHAENDETALSFERYRPYIMPIASKGFTIIELMVTIVVVAVLAAVAIPSMGNFISQTRLSGNVKYPE
jgi:prepilin-type N-terminal cleavage/methylation domain-containing protein